jgi:tetratricopeptide (TPR) repeat protein
VKQRHGEITAATTTTTTIVLLFLAGSCAGPRALSPYEQEMVKLTRSARDAYDRSAHRQAARLYREALARARAADDPAGIADSAYNTAVCLMTLGVYEGTGALLVEAQEAKERRGETPGAILLVRATLARLTGDREKAELLLDELWTSLGDSYAPALRAQVYLLGAHVACDRSDGEGARRALDRAAEHLPWVEDPLVRAEAADVRGRVLLLEGRPAEAAASFDRAVELLARERRFRRMAAALGRAGRAYRNAGDMAAAADRLYRGGRSLRAQGDSLGALRLIEAALPENETELAEPARRRLERLFKEVKNAVESKKGAAADAGVPAS